MRKSIYIQLLLVFIGVFMISNLGAFFITVLTGERGFVEEMKDQLLSSVVNAKEVYESGDATGETIEKLLGDKYLPVKFIDDISGYTAAAETLSRLSGGEAVFLEKIKPNRRSHAFPVAAVKSGDFYIIAEPAANSFFSKISYLLRTTGIISVLIGSLIFLLAAGMIVRPIRKLTQATKKVASGNFDVTLKVSRKDEIGQLIESFNTMTKELKSIEILRNDFISDISHEFKTPLMAIGGYTKLLRDSQDNKEKNEYIDIIIGETERLSRLAGDILTLNRVENENIVPDKKPYRLDEQIRKAILLSENKWSSQGIDLQVDLEDITFTGNEHLLYDVWLNLLDNAIKFSPEGERIIINLGTEGDKIVFSIRDFGYGISPEDQKRIFEKFYKGDKSRSSPGTGLGLSIVRRIIAMHNGVIELSSTPGQGTEITVKLECLSAE